MWFDEVARAEIDDLSIEAKKNPGQNANHQKALVVNDTNTRRFSFRTPGSVATLRPEKNLYS